MDKYLSPLERFILHQLPKLRKGSIIVILCSLPLIYALVYFTGGIKYVYSHTMYIPILLAGFVLGKRWGTIIAFVAAILLGPLMPIDTATGESQLVMNYLYRMIVFVLVGFMSGYGSDLLRKQIKSILEVVLYNQETKVPNTNILLDYKPESDYRDGFFLMTIIINNANTIIDIMSLKKFHRIMFNLYQIIDQTYSKPHLIVQSSIDKLWCVKPIGNIEEDMKLLKNALKEQIIIDDVPFYVEFSVGCSFCEDLKMIHNLEAFSKSDISARESYKENKFFVFYDEKFFKKRRDFELLGSFISAIVSNQLYLVYQPKMDLVSNKPYGLEALIRWKHPTKGNIFPDTFIPLIEETKLIHSLTNFVISKAVQQYIRFKNRGIDTTISINVSGKDISHPEFANHLISAIQMANVNPTAFEIEITETSIMANPEESKEVLQRIFDAGIKISLDDYGTGYSSLAYLSTFPIRVLKIDRTFTKQISTNSSVRHIVKSTIDLAHELNYQVIAEGVEQQQDENILHELGCDKAQGYYYSKPLYEDDIVTWIEQHR